VLRRSSFGTTQWKLNRNSKTGIIKKPPIKKRVEKIFVVVALKVESHRKIHHRFAFEETVHFPAGIKP
jgi:hypothetical protein